MLAVISVKAVGGLGNVLKLKFTINWYGTIVLASTDPKPYAVAVNLTR